MKRYDSILRPRRDALIVDSTQKLLERNLINFDRAKVLPDEEDAIVAHVIAHSADQAQVGSAPYTSALLNNENPPILPFQIKVIPKSLDLIYPTLDIVNKNSLPLAYPLPGTVHPAVTEGQKVRIRFIDALRNEAIIVHVYDNNTVLSTQNNQGGLPVSSPSQAFTVSFNGPREIRRRGRNSYDFTKVNPIDVTNKPYDYVNQISLAAVDFFILKGWTPQQASGLVGNLMSESGPCLNMTLVGDNGTAFGIAQWRFERVTNFSTKYPGGQGRNLRSPSTTTRDVQLGFVQWELENTHKPAAIELKKADNPSVAAATVDMLYEQSAGGATNARKVQAESLFKAYTDKKNGIDIKISKKCEGK